MATTYNNLYMDIRQTLRRAGIEAATLEDGGTFEIGNADGGGALVTITLPIPPHTEHR